MANVAVVGSQWGDEGKGKIVDWLSERADVVVRFQGGHNAGHTLVIGDKVYKLSLLPSGVVRPDKVSIIGNGVVVDPWALLKEIDAITEMGVAVSPDTLKVAENASLAIMLLQGESRQFWNPFQHVGIPQMQPVAGDVETGTWTLSGPSFTADLA